MKTHRFQVLAAIWKQQDPPGHKKSALSHPLPHFILFFQTVPKNRENVIETLRAERVGSKHINDL